MRVRMVDRRARPRFDIIGPLFGTMETVIALPLRNISYGGALVESDVPLASNTEHHVTVTCVGVDAPMQVRVKHVRETRDAVGRLAYLIGLEFVNLGAPLRAQIANWLAGPETGSPS